jgi:hypothetical protein
VTDSLIPEAPPELPKPSPLYGAQQVLEELAAFVDVTPAYQQAGSEHLVAVIGFLAWARSNQYVAREVKKP